MKTILIIMLLSFNMTVAQTFIDLSVGTASQPDITATVISYQTGVRYQPGVIGVKGTFSQTDGLYHTFDSYTASATVQPFKIIYINLGYRYDNNRGWYDDRQGLNAGVNALIPIMPSTDITVGASHTFNNAEISNILAGFQFKLSAPKTKNKRFF